MERLPSAPPRPEKRAFEFSRFVLAGERSEQPDAVDVQTHHFEPRDVLDIVLADGHGWRGADFSQQAVRSFQKYLSTHGTFEEAEAKRSFERVQHQLTERGLYAHADGFRGGTTATIARIEGHVLRLAWVGDSQARTFGQDGTFHTVTMDHAFGKHPVETRRLRQYPNTIIDPKNPFAESPRLGRVLSPDGTSTLALTRSLGDEDFSPHVSHEPEFKHVVLTDQQRFFIVASDGFWNTLDTAHKRHTMERALSQARSSAEAAQIAQHTLAPWRMRDNTAMVIVGL